jgi:hypothetical protein
LIGSSEILKARRHTREKRVSSTLRPIDFITNVVGILDHPHFADDDSGEWVRIGPFTAAP